MRRPIAVLELGGAAAADGDRKLWFPRSNDTCPNLEEIVLLTESTVESMFRELMKTEERTEETFDKAEELLEDELRPESPLRHRLTVELEELRMLATKS
ncbi:hypothetical protein Poly51_54720 [Rubripirellula tenax]|uniref:Uncharacterized protein n=1 Tax=Rubripirellula tenax TaxID=2528015 RepID=A0A5C6EDK6_9BACT|nr:hypothetical protein Poly51_54720 [Rubripirellula tenax]